jgi:DNA replication and repair protein RecF
MTVRKLWIQNVRCLEHVVLEAADRNLIYGQNASGKTSLLEAIFVLGRGRSFRGAQREGLIRDGEAEALVSGKVARGDLPGQIGLAFRRGGAPRVRVNGKDETSAAALAEWLPVQVLDPGLHRLVDEGPGVRRRFLDWGLFHVEQDFLGHWRRYQRSLRQRNAALKDRSLGDLSAWDDRVGAEGETLTVLRTAYLESLRGAVQSFGQRLLGEEIQLDYRQGWSQEKSLVETLRRSRDRDRRFGATQVGPHRADISIDLADQQARGRVSRGQQKLLAASLVLAQLQDLQDRRGIRGVLLMDDIAAELDRESLGKLMEAVTGLGAQLFITALGRHDVPMDRSHSLFHVEQGKVVSVV